MDQPSQQSTEDLLLTLWADTWASGNLVGPDSTTPKLAKTELTKRIRIMDMGARKIETGHFRQLLHALLNRNQIRMLYHGRSRDETSERVVSPQRLIRYRGNWYLDTWCHMREDMRHFAVDRIHPIGTLDTPAREIPDEVLDQHFASAYGIFSGDPKATAVLRFNADAARWVADEQWHPQQQSQIHRDGSVEMRIPYGVNRELIMDILRYGPDVEVLEPIGLRDRVAQLAARTAALYRPQRRASA